LHRVKLRLLKLMVIIQFIELFGPVSRIDVTNLIISRLKYY